MDDLYHDFCGYFVKTFNPKVAESTPSISMELHKGFDGPNTHNTKDLPNIVGFVVDDKSDPEQESVALGDAALGEWLKEIEPAYILDFQMWNREEFYKKDHPKAKRIHIGSLGHPKQEPSMAKYEAKIVEDLKRYIELKGKVVVVYGRTKLVTGAVEKQIEHMGGKVFKLYK